MEKKQIVCDDCCEAGFSAFTAEVIRPAVMSWEDYHADMSAFTCPCGAHLRKTDSITDYNTLALDLSMGERFTCRCGQTVDEQNAVLTILPTSEAALDAGTLIYTQWFHATTVEDWLNKVQADSIYIHAGTKEAALERVRDSHFDDPYSEPTDVYLWQFSISPFAVVADDILKDENRWSTHVSDCTRGHLGGDVQRYLNTWESTGSVSVLLDPAWIIEAKAIRLTESDCRKMLGSEQKKALVAA